MADALRATLIGDGGTERLLCEVAQWVLRPLVPEGVVVTYADLRGRTVPPRGLRERADEALRLYPADMLIIHRDAEARPLAERRAEIAEALEGHLGIVVALVPVRMTEAWLLFDEPAIRRAAGNPNGRENLSLPRLAAVEDLPDPKAVLHDALKAAADLSRRRTSRFNVRAEVHRVAALIDSFAPLRGLRAFDEFERDLQSAVSRWRGENESGAD